jgi:hypothetical protein
MEWMHSVCSLDRCALRREKGDYEQLGELIHIYFLICRFRNECKAGGKKLMVWTVNSPDQMMEVCLNRLNYFCLLNDLNL